MSIGFYWFKSYKIKIDENCFYTDVNLKYLGGGSTSHSAGNIQKVQNLLEKYGGNRIPEINKEFICSDKLDLIKPKEMSKMCYKVLASTEVDELDMRERIEWFKELSDEGYYLIYDVC